MKSVCSKFLLILSLVILSQSSSTWASSGVSLFEGKITSLKANGFYDLRFKVWDKSQKNSAKNFQTIDMPRVQVKGGSFTVAVDAGLADKLEKNLTLKIESRRFESWSAYEPAELSNFVFRFEKKSKQPQFSVLDASVNQKLVVISRP